MEWASFMGFGFHNSLGIGLFMASCYYVIVMLLSSPYFAALFLYLELYCNIVSWV